MLVAEHLDDACAAWLAQRADVVWASSSDDPELFYEQLTEAQGLIVRTYTQVNDAMLQKAPQLKVVARAGVGLDNVDVAACRRRNIEVVYTPDANTQAVVEYIFAVMFDAVRPLTELRSEQDLAQFHELRRTHVGKQLDQLTLGIVGLGRIGQKLARVAHTLGMNLMGCDLLPEATIRKSLAVPLEFADLSTVLARSDVVSIHVDGRSSNRHLIDAAALAKLRPHALMINASRGMVLDAHALTHWLQTHAGDGAQAVLDVYDPEPPEPTAATLELLSLANCRAIPHLASRTHTAMANMSWVVRDVHAVLTGSPPTYPAPQA